jgi:hypothetical protein
MDTPQAEQLGEAIVALRPRQMSAFQTEVMTALGWPPPQHYAGLTPLPR